jgi:hypothetical protein
LTAYVLAGGDVLAVMSHYVVAVFHSTVVQCPSHVSKVTRPLVGRE